MKVIILPSAESGLRWYQHYYAKVFPEGKRHAKARFSATLRVLESNPRSGVVMSDLPVRKISIIGTPFQFIYRVGNEHVEILKLWDGRGNPDEMTSGI